MADSFDQWCKLLSVLASNVINSNAVCSAWFKTEPDGCNQLLRRRATPIRVIKPDIINQTAAGTGTAGVEAKLMLSYNIPEGV